MLDNHKNREKYNNFNTKTEQRIMEERHRDLGKQNTFDDHYLNCHNISISVYFVLKYE